MQFKGRASFREGESGRDLREWQRWATGEVPSENRTRISLGQGSEAGGAWTVGSLAARPGCSPGICGDTVMDPVRKT